MSNDKIRLIFMGTPDFACPGLKSLLELADFDIVGVYTQPDKAVGRSKILKAPPVKELAKQYKIPVFQPKTIKAEAEIHRIKELKPDLIVVIAYGQIIPPAILDIPQYGCLNVHASLLPKYRGASCLNAPILNGDDKTGVTIMKMDAGMDTGPIIRQVELALNGTETLENVHDSLSALGAAALAPTLKDWINNKIKAKVQNEEQATYVKILNKEDGLIDFNSNATKIERQIRGLNPWPGTYFEYQSNTSKNKILVKILKVDHEIIKLKTARPGHFFLYKGQLALGCGQDALLILILQLEGKKAVSGPEFINGHPDMISH